MGRVRRTMYVKMHKDGRGNPGQIGGSGERAGSWAKQVGTGATSSQHSRLSRDRESSAGLTARMAGYLLENGLPNKPHPPGDAKM